MRTAICALLLFIFHRPVRGDCDNDKSHLATVRLHNYLFCDYDPNLRPVVNHQNSTTVTLRMLLKNFNFETTSNSIGLDFWLSVTWIDEHLRWNPDEYESISTMYFHTSEIWTPDISVYNRENQGDDPDVIDGTKCAVSHTGMVVCVPPVHIDSLCIPDITKYPFDTQNCTIRFGSWIHKGEELNLVKGSNFVDIEDLVPNGEWELLATEVTRNPGIYKCCPNTTYPSINISLKMKRISGSYAASVAIPSIVGVILVLTSLWISPANTDRLTLCYVNLLTHFLHLQYISFMVPLKGDSVPLLICFARDSLLLCVFTIVFSVFLKNLVQEKTPAPYWISKTVSFITACKPGQVVFLNDYSIKGVAASKGEEDGSTIINNSETASSNDDWQVFARILDRFLFLIYLFVYIIMMLAFIP